MPSILAIDQGTTGTTALVLHQDGTVIGRAYRELPQHFPRPGWVEHDPLDIIRGAVEAGRDAIKAAGEQPVGIGITNQRETVLLWDRATLEPLGRAIVWQDRRTAPRCAELRAQGMEPLVRERTGLLLDPYFSGTKLELLLQSREVRRRAERGELAAGTVDCWLVARLTGGAAHVTDHTNASRTLLYGLEERAWDTELLTLFEIPPAVLPEIRPSGGLFGESRPEHFGRAMPIAGIAGDQQGALFGQGCVSAGSAKNTYGTGTFLLMHTGKRRPNSSHGLLTTAACGPRGEPAFALEGSVFIAGAAIQWLRDGLGLLGSAAESEALARSVEDTAGVHFVPAFVGLGSPHWEPEARGTLTGLTRGTTRAHIVRAALEAMAFSSTELVEMMRDDAGLEIGALRVDGGASANDWLMQFLADVLGSPVERPDMVETTALGAAGLAGIALGVWPDTEAFLAGRTFVRFDPDTTEAVRAERRAGWERAVKATLAWARADS
ncbi:MAG TPA: glycerol kinase GlpK [Gemmatimonadales bacterium]|nr:glycerol kinase GlpK [Gemmatimonadales bacterium]